MTSLDNFSDELSCGEMKHGRRSPIVSSRLFFGALLRERRRPAKTPTANLSLILPCHDRPLVHEILGVRPGAGEKMRGSDSQDRRGQRGKALIAISV